MTRMVCPLCSWMLEEEEDNTLVYCRNPSCPIVGIQPYFKPNSGFLPDDIVKRGPRDSETEAFESGEIP